MDTNQQLTDYLAKVDALGTPEAKIESLKGAVNTLFGEKETAVATASQLKTMYESLEAESTTEIERLSKELSFSTSAAGKTTCSVEVDGVRYTTPTGRKYNIAGKEIAVEDLVKDAELVKQLIGKKSAIFTVATTE